MSEAAHLPVGLVYDERLTAYNFGPSHPMQPSRLILTVELLRALDLLAEPGACLLPFQPATREELQLVHAGEYVDAVAALSADPAAALGRLRDQALRAGLTQGDNPVFRGVHEASALVAGATLAGARAVMDGTVAHAFSVAGGLHHAHHDHAAGFCIYNDPAIAIAGMRQQYGCRVAYVDVDAHHGDGVQERFYDDPHVLTISLHESGRYQFPGAGFVEETGEGAGYGYAANLPLEPYTGDELFLSAFRAVVPPLLRSFHPDLIVVEAGVDSHYTDPITHLATTTNLWPPLIGELHGLAHELCGGRLLVTGGGGYQPHTVAPRAWTLVFAALRERVPLDDRLPPAWLTLCRRYAKGDVPQTLLDREALEIPADYAEQIATLTASTIRQLQRELFPLHGLAPA